MQLGVMNAVNNMPAIGSRVVDLRVSGDCICFVFDDGSCVTGRYDRSELLRTVAGDAELDQALTMALKRENMPGAQPQGDPTGGFAESLPSTSLDPMHPAGVEMAEVEVELPSALGNL